MTYIKLNLHELVTGLHSLIQTRMCVKFVSTIDIKHIFSVFKEADIG
jgi:hypothetical protein